MPRMRLLLISYLFFVISFDVSAQRGRKNLADAVIMVGQQKTVIDSVVLSLIQIKEDSLTNDSVKVEIVYFLAELACDTCLLYLIEHMNDRFNYGLGTSDIDQFNYLACWGMLAKLSKQDNTKWKVLAAIFYSLKMQPRDDMFYEFLLPVVLSITSKEAMKAIVEDKLAEISTKWNKIYTKNLTQLLEGLSK